MTMKRGRDLGKVRRVVVKIGSSLLTGPQRAGVRRPFLGKIAHQVRSLSRRKIQTVIVTSGAIATGRHRLGLSQKPKEISKLQALAAFGQSGLMHAYETVFARIGLKVAQILLTREDLSHRVRYTNAHNTFQELFEYGIVPVVNENDSVAVEEIRFGDNDTLGVLVSHLTEADLLVLLTDIDGFFTDDPRFDPEARLVEEMTSIDPEHLRKARDSSTGVGTGGMQTKIKAAQTMMRSGIPMVIANGNVPDVLIRILKGERLGTFFRPLGERMNSRKRWLGWGVDTKGKISIDAGAQKALLEKHKSLLAAGVKGLKGDWEGGEVVEIVGPDGSTIAKGISNYSSAELSEIKGMKSSEIAQKHGEKASGEVVHIDNLVMI